MPSPTIQFPAGYAPGQAAAFADQNGNARLVSASTPLPMLNVPAPVTPLAGSTSTTGTVGPYLPVTGRSVILALSGTWTGSVQVARSTDGGATLLPITIGGSIWGLFSTNCCEAVWDESDSSAQLYLQISLTAGAVTYRFSQ